MHANVIAVPSFNERQIDNRLIAPARVRRLFLGRGRKRVVGDLFSIDDSIGFWVGNGRLLLFEGHRSLKLVRYRWTS